MPDEISNFVFGAIYRAKALDSHASSRRFNCYMPASPDIPARAYVADCWVCDAFGRVDPGLSHSPVPVRKEDLGSIINVVRQGMGL